MNDQRLRVDGPVSIAHRGVDDAAGVLCDGHVMAPGVDGLMRGPSTGSSSCDANGTVFAMCRHFHDDINRHFAVPPFRRCVRRLDAGESLPEFMSSAGR